MDLTQLKDKLPLVEECLSHYLDSNITNERLKESMGYSLFAGGKRIRPLLALSIVDLFDFPIDQTVIQAVSAIEMVHTYSLIHDDLPAMDDDRYRRGKLTNHCQFDEATAILAGDALLTDAFYLLSELEISAEQKVALMGLLAQASGGQGMVAGQMDDIESEGKSLPLEKLQTIHEKKTGALLTYSLVTGLILTNRMQSLSIVEHLGYHLGLAFQIRDDILDVVGTKEMLGKETHRDEALEKNTYPRLLGLDGAYQALYSELDDAKRDLSYLTDKPTALSEIIEQLRLTKEL